ncbi:MAG: DNA-binding response regulator [Chloroflexi bacterium]|nr:MAG: DNA-binding response regulator [Chloroflexota bacterium]
MAKILVVDDEETMRRSLAEILRLDGYHVQVAASGAAAIDALQDGTFDLMLLDLKMPGMDGVEVMRRAVKLSPETMIVMLTAHGSLESAIEALRHEAFDYLLKPSSPEQIRTSVEGALARREEVVRKRSIIDFLDTSIKELRKSERGSGQVHKEEHQVETVHGVTVDISRRELSRDGARVSLTASEAKLFKILLENRGKVLTHRELVLHVQGYETKDWEAAEVMRPLISRLRKKLLLFPGGKNWITNVRGTGYIFNFIP